MTLTKTLIVVCVLLTASLPTVAALGRAPIDSAPLPAKIADRLGRPSGEQMGQVVLEVSQANSKRVNYGCHSVEDSSIEWERSYAFKVPERVKGEKVTGWRITTDMQGTGACVAMTRGGTLVHHGFPGSWSTLGTFEPGTYVLRATAAGAFQLRVTMDLATGPYSPVPMPAAF